MEDNAMRYRKEHELFIYFIGFQELRVMISTGDATYSLAMTKKNIHYLNDTI